MTFAIRNVDIVTPFRIIQQGTIIVEGKKIAGIGKTAEVAVPKGIRTYDLDGMILTPGYIDLLVHGGGGYGFTDMSREAVEHISQHFFRHGTTGLLASLYSKPESDMVADVSRIAEFCMNSKASNVWGMHLEGPFINKKWHGAMKVDYLWQPSVEGWTKLHAAGQGYIRLMTLAPELPGMAEVMRAAAKNGVVLSIGHSAAMFEEVLMAIDNGAAHITHLFNAMTPFHHRQPSVAVAALLLNELKVELIADGFHVHPAVMKLIYNIKGDGGIILITDAIRASGMPDGEYSFMDQKIIVREKKAYLENGTLAGSTLTMEAAVKNMVELVGVPLTDAVRMASLNGAKVLGLEHKKGILAVGKDADLVVLNRNFDVQMTIYEGGVKYNATT
ncbi:MAG TPA: N-acetylglucosamine-6-phosphate deacetylase [Bacteroidetes bacterium]|nr:MAG: N-acetylglucosamine-6-phosphate deacetylase [Ignavibacteria bacterium GWA2_54_16]HCA79475.1 N-acetylglucosamine-6-phosphate deacetylase [Bacteroidota bacterium]